MVIRAKSTVPMTTLRAVVSREPDLISPVPELTARVARAAFPKGNPYLRLRDELGPVFRDGDFADLYPRRGQPALPPWKLALVTVLQFAEDLSDRQAADAVRGRIDWKYALGLELDDPGFDFSVLSEFRGRLTAGGAERLLLDEMLEACKDRGLLKARARQRTDSTHVLAATRDLNRLELVGETLRATLNALATVAPEWLRPRVPPEWFDRHAARVEETRLPKGQEARYAHAEVIGGDGYRLLEALRRDAAAAWLWQVPAVEVLRRVWLTQFYLDDGRVRWRTAADLAPAGQRINTPYDAEATFGDDDADLRKRWRSLKKEEASHEVPICPPALLRTRNSLAGRSGPGWPLVALEVQVIKRGQGPYTVRWKHITIRNRAPIPTSQRRPAHGVGPGVDRKDPGPAPVSRVGRPG